jgi:hypothetical protein
MVQSDIRTVPIPGQLLQHEDVHLGQLGGGLPERGARGEAAAGQAGAHLDARGAGPGGDPDAVDRLGTRPTLKSGEAD